MKPFLDKSRVARWLLKLFIAHALKYRVQQLSDWPDESEKDINVCIREDEALNYWINYTLTLPEEEKSFILYLPK
jgi:hypothetical protein